MTNLYRQNSGESRKGRRHLLFATVLVVLMVIADGLSGGNIRMLVRSSAATLWSGTERAGDIIFGSGFFSTRRALLRENALLRTELLQLKLRAAGFEVLRSENEHLRELARLAEDEQGITAPIVSSLRSSPYGTFLIGAGSLNGVRAGNIVIIGDPLFGGFVVGRVDSADTHTSLVTELFAPDQAIEGVARGISISFEGRGGGQARGEAPRDAEIVEGDAVISPIVGNRAIGIVGEVEKDTGGAVQRVYVSVPVNLYDVRFVYVLTE